MKKRNIFKFFLDVIIIMKNLGKNIIIKEN